MTFEELSVKLCNIVWSTPLIVILLFAGIYFSLATKFVQIRRAKKMRELLFASDATEKGVSSFQAFALSIAGRVGTGNIAGVATAISLGGPGAMFWMWVLASLGSATSFVECTLGQIYKTEVDGEYRGGPAYYFEKVSGKKIFGIIFAILSIISMVFLVPGIQSNSISNAIVGGVFTGVQKPETLKLIIGIICGVLIGLVIFGGTKRLGYVAEKVVPFMSILYVGVAIIIIMLNITKMPSVLAMIITEAFSPRAGLGGVIGTAVLNGVKRGIFSNEAGQGTGPHAAAAANVNHPCEQGLVQAFSVYFDTLLVCSMTGFMILLTDSYNLINSAGEMIYQGSNAQGLDVGPAFTQAAASTVLGNTLGPIFVAVALFFFAFTTLMSYYYIAESNAAYLSRKVDKETGLVKSSPKAIFLTRIAFICCVVFFSAKSSAAVWNFADVGIGIMAWYNVIGILIIGRISIRALKDYDEQLKNGVKHPIFDADKISIKNSHFWE